VSFTFKGERCKETLGGDKPWAPTQTNLAVAERLMVRVREALDLDRRGLKPFDYKEHFPDSKRARGVAAAVDPDELRTFGQFATAYHEGLDPQKYAPATRSQYENELKRWKKRIGADKPMADIKHSWLVGIVGKVKFPSPQMRNNSLIPLRGTFALWVADDKRNRVDPMEGISNATRQKEQPDPYEWDEAMLIMADMRKHDPLLAALYYVLAFNTGMRPEELIAFRWVKMDWKRCRGLVDTVRTFKGGEKKVKTKRARWVNFNSAAMAALRELRALTELKKHGHVLENPATGEPWHDDRKQRDNYWKPCIRRLRLRYRDPYKTRSTRATAMLMRGMNPAYCAAQLGQSKRVFWETYAEWIELAEKANDRERAKDEAGLEPVSEEKAG
jgi:integrase